MPWSSERATALPKVFVVIWQGFGLQNGLLIFTGFATEARCDCRLSRVSRRCTACVPIVADFQNPLAAERTLHCQVPTAGTRHDKVPWHLESEDVGREQRAGASSRWKRLRSSQLESCRFLGNPGTRLGTGQMWDRVCRHRAKHSGWR